MFLTSSLLSGDNYIANSMIHLDYFCTIFALLLFRMTRLLITTEVVINNRVISENHDDNIHEVIHTKKGRDGQRM